MKHNPRNLIHFLIMLAVLLSVGSAPAEASNPLVESLPQPANCHMEPLFIGSPIASPGTTTLVSVAAGGTQVQGDSWFPSISGDGRYVAFHSRAANIVREDTNAKDDVFVHDRQTGVTTRVSVSSDGSQGTGDSGNVSISADGRFVAFWSLASNLVSADTNGVGDVFVHDRQSGKTTRVSVSSAGTQANEYSGSASISAGGRYVAFTSLASNLVSDDTNDVLDVFVHDRQTGETTRVSVASDGSQANGDSGSASISADGRHVAFWSLASDLVSGDTNGVADIFVHDRQTGETTRVTVSSAGTQANEYSARPSISAEGRYVAFMSFASNLVSDDTNGMLDIFVHDRQMGETTRVSVASDGTQANGFSGFPSISAGGHFVAFLSFASNLVSEDTTGTIDIFVRDRGTFVCRDIWIFLPLVVH